MRLAASLLIIFLTPFAQAQEKKGVPTDLNFNVLYLSSAKTFNSDANAAIQLQLPLALTEKAKKQKEGLFGGLYISGRTLARKDRQAASTVAVGRFYYYLDNSRLKGELLPFISLYRSLDMRYGMAAETRTQTLTRWFLPGLQYQTRLMPKTAWHIEAEILDLEKPANHFFRSGVSYAYSKQWGLSFTVQQHGWDMAKTSAAGFASMSGRESSLAAKAIFHTGEWNFAFSFGYSRTISHQSELFDEDMNSRGAYFALETSLGALIW